MPHTTTGRNKLLDSGKAAITHLGAFTDLGVTEVTGGSYARQAVTFAAASGAACSNSAQISIPIPAGTTVPAIGAFDALTSGNILGFYPWGSTGQVVVGVGIVDATGTDLIRSNGHGLTTDDRVMVWAANGEALPTGLSASTLYYVLASGLTADAFKLSTSSGGAAVDITALGELWFAKTVPNTFASAGNLVIAAGAFVLDLLRA